MIWLMLVPAWCFALVALVALCRAGHLEDVARGFSDDVVPLPVTPLMASAVRVPSPRSEVLPLAR